ncbi:DNA-binding response regulator, partial [ANME-2 cluster archaeon]
EINPDIKILFASADAAIKNDALESGACNFLSKPFAIVDLLAEIEEMLTE